jgi:hypothetical protein
LQGRPTQATFLERIGKSSNGAAKASAHHSPPGGRRGRKAPRFIGEEIYVEEWNFAGSKK